MALLAVCSTPVFSDNDSWELVSRVSHPSGSRHYVEYSDIAPGPTGPQKTFGSMPIPIV